MNELKKTIEDLTVNILYIISRFSSFQVSYAFIFKDQNSKLFIEKIRLQEIENKLKFSEESRKILLKYMSFLFNSFFLI